MISIEMRTIGEVSFENSVKTAEGYQYDIPCDRFGIPCIPIGRELSELGVDLKGITVGFAHPDGFIGLSVEAEKIISEVPEALSFIRGYFTNTRFLEKENYSVRSLKSGQIFFASLSFPAGEYEQSTVDREEALKAALSGIKQIGVNTGEITGEVSLSLVEMDELFVKPQTLSDLCSYHALDYSVLLVTPTSFYQPYADGPTTSLYIPGAEIRELLRKALSIEEKDGEDLICTNAYLSDGSKRLLPVPACASLVKNDKTQLRYRIAPGRDPHRSEQPAGLSDRYTGDTESHLITYTAPETERIRSIDGTMADALTAGQSFSGTVYGSDEQIRRIEEYFRKHAIINLGTFAEEGFGEVCVKIDAIREQAPKATVLADTFDVSCLSDTLLLNEEGMPAVSAEDLLGEIEYILNMPGELAIESKYTGIYKDFSKNIRWDRDGVIVRCIAKGAILRVRRKDNKPVDIFPILHTFIGERVNDGWGEIRTLPARDGYYRLAMQVTPVYYAVSFPDSLRRMNQSALLVAGVIEDILRSRIRSLAIVDREEYRQGVPASELMPEEILMEYRERYAPQIPVRTLFDWYEEGLKDDAV
ncbi:MAG: hypothetical protein K6G42_07600 [Lachnospiraceae bacterium]|nr:hypothetical protein [Lachnospiraceae bacterium]